MRLHLVWGARAMARTKNTHLSVKYHRIAKRRGVNRASIAVGRTMLQILYVILTRKEQYRGIESLETYYWDW
ncbi:hypothetical protein AP057_08750 [Geobacillus sp. Sah69]|nr:hypothetical protein IB49_06790 [Geobacillus sp. LC300]EQB94566.1 hypothetical protein GA8_16180 [Geobacillus sp. A8]KDE45839.1 hypothetical protein DI44_18605 [Geobacillus sp. CAMR5420]KQC46393.1 hypothetical protein AP057_08750 [Geobacillus sp. Sah69]PJW13061.1 hypothetical protein CV945_16365 [Geobacillus sp. Manikaran-105]PJW16182.1 hypothetical protein CV944_16070 [Geobacillus sp. WSUCF-018B]